MSELKKLLDKSMESGKIWVPEREGALLVGVITNVRPDSFKPEQKAYTVKQYELKEDKWVPTGEFFQTPSHTVLKNALSGYEADTGDFVQICYDGLAEKPSKYGQKAKLYSVGVVKRLEAEKYLGETLPKPSETSAAETPKKVEKPTDIQAATSLIDQMLGVFSEIPLRGDGSIEYFVNTIRGIKIEPEDIVEAMGLVKTENGKYKKP